MNEELKQLNEVIDNTSQKIADAINKSHLAPAIIELILERCLQQVTISKLSMYNVSSEAEGETDG